MNDEIIIIIITTTTPPGNWELIITFDELIAFKLF